jgi:ankyrin repeat protein
MVNHLDKIFTIVTKCPQSSRSLVADIMIGSVRNKSITVSSIEAMIVIVLKLYNITAGTTIEESMKSILTRASSSPSSSTSSADHYEKLVELVCCWKERLAELQNTINNAASKNKNIKNVSTNPTISSSLSKDSKKSASNHTKSQNQQQTITTSEAAHSSQIKEDDDFLVTALHGAVKNGNRGAVEKLLASSLSSTISESEAARNFAGLLPLAVVHGHADVVAALLVNPNRYFQNQVNQPDPETGRTPLFLAAHHKNESCVKALFENSKIPIETEIADSSLFTPLFVAVKEKQIQIVAEIAKNTRIPQNANEKALRGFRSALQVAISAKFDSAIAVMEKRCVKEIYGVLKFEMGRGGDSLLVLCVVNASDSSVPLLSSFPEFFRSFRLISSTSSASDSAKPIISLLNLAVERKKIEVAKLLQKASVPFLWKVQTAHTKDFDARAGCCRLGCTSTFGLFTSKYFCCSCALAFCSSCSSDRKFSESVGWKRVCHECFSSLSLVLHE